MKLILLLFKCIFDKMQRSRSRSRFNFTGIPHSGIPDSDLNQQHGNSLEMFSNAVKNFPEFGADSTIAELVAACKEYISTSPKFGGGYVGQTITPIRVNQTQENANFITKNVTPACFNGLSGEDNWQIYVSGPNERLTDKKPFHVYILVTFEFEGKKYSEIFAFEITFDKSKWTGPPSLSQINFK
jgi:hypothetical protein